MPEHSESGRSALAPLCVCIIGMLQPGTVGGVEQAVRGTITALGKLTDGDERYTVVVEPISPHWLDASIGSNTRIVVHPRSVWRTRARRLLGPGTRFGPRVDKLYHLAITARSRIRRYATHGIAVDAFLESLNADVYHFPYQWFAATAKPSLFDPQDVQHLHHPEFFGKPELAFRRMHYPEWCRDCSMLEVPSTSTKRDLVSLMGLDPRKIAMVPKGPPTALEPIIVGDPRSEVADLEVPDVFALYPAQTWPHKNHRRLLKHLPSFATKTTFTCTSFAPAVELISGR